MRLLDTTTFQLTEFYTGIPKYAILSHTWDQEEVTYRDIQDLEIAQRKSGWPKVEGVCAYARKFKFRWIWIDSCCINKESSAELSEAINSMYQYYLEAEVCYVYLSDVSQQKGSIDSNSTFRRSRWFTRGWTLQELLAPAFAVFLDQDWLEIGTKWSLRETISTITSIPSRVLEDGNVDRYNIAQRMSWAAPRKTTRPEDQAYCLMGIFGVNMPTIYGEGGTKAFMRLQQEIIKISDDRSIFIWLAPPEETEPSGLFARSPYEFRASGDVRDSHITGITNTSFSFNNNGLQIHLPLVRLALAVTTPTKPLVEEGEFLALIGRVGSGTDAGAYIYICLQKTSGGHYFRRHTSEWVLSFKLLPKYSIKEVVVKEKRSLGRMASQKPLCIPRHPTPQNCAYYGDLSWESPDRKLVYKIQVGGREEFFTVDIQKPDQLKVTTELSELSLSKIVKTPGKCAFFPKWQVLGQDRIRTPLKSGGLVDLVVHITGENPKSVISYLSPEKPSIPAPIKKSLTPRLLVPMAIPHINNFLKTSFLSVSEPLSFVQNAYSGEQVYIPIPNSGNSIRILYYVLLPHTIIFVAFGFQGTRFWMDSTMFDINFWSWQKVAEAKGLVLNSYLDGGSRANARMECQTSKSHFIPWGGHKLTITAEQKDDPQRDTYVLRLVVSGGNIVSAINMRSTVRYLTLEKHTAAF